MGMKLKLSILAAAALLAGAAHAQWIPTGAGPYNFNDTANWTGATINGAFSSSLTAAQTANATADLTLSSGLSFTNPSATARTQLLQGFTASTFSATAVTAGGVFTVASTAGLTSGQIVRSTGAQNGLNAGYEYILNVIDGTTFSLSQNAASPTLNTITTNGTLGTAVFNIERSVTLGGGISVATTNVSSFITLGSTTAVNALNLNMGGAARAIDVAAGESLNIINAITGAYALTKSGAGTLQLGLGAATITASNFNALHITGGTVNVTGTAGSGSVKGAPVSSSAGTGTITMDNGTALGISGASTLQNLISLNASGGSVFIRGANGAELVLDGGISGTGDFIIDNKPTSASNAGVQISGSAIASTYVGNVFVNNSGTYNGTVSAGLSQLRLSGTAGTTKVTGDLTVNGNTDGIHTGYSQLVSMTSNLIANTSTVTLNQNSQWVISATSVSDVITKLVVNDNAGTALQISAAAAASENWVVGATTNGTYTNAASGVYLRNGGFIAGNGKIGVSAAGVNAIPVFVNQAGGTIIAGSTNFNAGTTVGTLVIGGNMTATTDFTLDLNMNGTNGDTSLLSLTGTADTFVGSTVTLNFANLNLGSMATGTAYTILSGLELGPTGWTPGTMSGGLVLDGTYGTGGLLFSGTTLTAQFSAVPEPSTWALFGLGSTMLLYGYRRSRRRF